jgi:hypothetical protein
MSDVPLTKKMFFETEDAWGIPYTRFDVMKIKDVLDALRKFQKDVLKHKRIETQHFSCDGIWVMDILKLIEKRFGVLESQDEKEVEK